MSVGSALIRRATSKPVECGEPGIVTLASFTCQLRRALEHRMEENQRFALPDVLSDALKNRLFLVSVTMPVDALDAAHN
jgi:hypothetical protein